MGRMIIILVLFFTLTGCTTTIPAVKPSDVLSVNLGDSIQLVIDKIGNPNQILLKEIITDGKQKEIWLYETVGKIEHYGLIGPNTDLQLAQAEINRQKRLENPPYIISFIDGKVTSIKRQEITEETIRIWNN